jgi:hypothetical protein
MQNKPSRRHHTTAAERVRILETCERSHLTRQAFAAQQGIEVYPLFTSGGVRAFAALATAAPD